MCRNDYKKVFSRLESEEISLSNLISMVDTLEDALLYGSGDKETYAGTVSLLAELLRGHKDKLKELIDCGHELIKSDKLEYKEVLVNNKL